MNGLSGVLSLSVARNAVLFLALHILGAVLLGALLISHHHACNLLVDLNLCMSSTTEASEGGDVTVGLGGTYGAEPGRQLFLIDFIGVLEYTHLLMSRC